MERADVVATNRLRDAIAAGEFAPNERLVEEEIAALLETNRAVIRIVLARLEQEDGLSVSELAKPFPVSLPAVMKHLDVLAEAGLLTRTKAGRTVSCHLNAGPMEEAMGWLARYQRFWTQRLDALAALLDARRQGRE